MLGKMLPAGTGLAYSKYQKEKKAEKKEGWLTDKEVRTSSERSST